MELPKSKVAAKSKNPRVLLLYSLPKAGKTTALSELDNTLIIDLEKGTDMLDAVKVNVETLQELHQVGEAIKEQGKPYKRIAIDTISKLEEWCEASATKLYKTTNQGKNFTGQSVLELANGGGYLYLRLAYKKWLDYLQTLADEIILVGHLKDKMLAGVGEKKGTEVASKDIDLTGKLKAITCADADAIGYMYRTPEGALNVSFSANGEDMTAGSRCHHLRDYNGPFSWDVIYK